MSNDNPTAEGQPLDPHTLRVVIERLTERIASTRQQRDEDREDHALTTCERYAWAARFEALELALWDVSNIAKTANPRARVVVLPEPFSKPGSVVGVTDWPCGVWSDGKTVHITGSVVSAQTGPVVAGSILAAIEHVAGGAQ